MHSNDSCDKFMYYKYFVKCSRWEVVVMVAVLGLRVASGIGVTVEKSTSKIDESFAQLGFRSITHPFQCTRKK